MSAPLSELVRRGLAREVRGDAEVAVSGVRHDSRAIEPGDLFVAVPGRSVDGAKFVAGALARGAVAIATERELAVDVPQLLVDDARIALGALAAAVYGDPTSALAVVGVTGTNGKTTTTWMIDEALRALGRAPALLGTVESRGPGLRAPAPYTTPEGDEIARFARTVRDAGATHLVMEVSSHALAQHRADAVDFDVAAFTNLTQDHLDFHGTMEEYFAAKRRLFTELSPRASVINVDDDAGARLARELEGPVTRVSREGAEAEIVVESWSMEREGLSALVRCRGEQAELRSAMIGAHNVDNLLLALGCLMALEVPLGEAVDALGKTRGAPGRLERIDGLEGVMVLVDYAHTPDALSRALAALRPITPGRLFVVFGCGGDRDRGKRPLMGEVAARGADVAILTSDNPRTEDPLAILAAIEPGVAAGGMTRGRALAARSYDVEEDRREAIRRAIFAARPGDSVLIAGKGHEDYQLRGTSRLHFDDREEAGAAIRARGGGEA